MKFKCNRCGECCGPIPITIKMYERFKDLSQRKHVIHPWGDHEVVPLSDDLKCIFLTSENLCAVYNNRPKVCRIMGSAKLPCPVQFPDHPMVIANDHLIKEIVRVLNEEKMPGVQK